MRPCKPDHVVYYSKSLTGSDYGNHRGDHLNSQLSVTGFALPKNNVKFNFIYNTLRLKSIIDHYYTFKTISYHKFC